MDNGNDPWICLIGAIDSLGEKTVAIGISVIENRFGSKGRSSC